MNKDFDKKSAIHSSWAPHKIFNIGNSKSISLMEFIETIEEELGQKALKNFHANATWRCKGYSSRYSLLENWIDYKPSTTLKDGINKFIIGISLFIRKFNFQILSIPVLIPLPKLTPHQDLFV